MSERTFVIFKAGGINGEIAVDPKRVTGAETTMHAERTLLYYSRPSGRGVTVEGNLRDVLARLGIGVAS